jgi:dienelactone hydrolase
MVALSYGCGDRPTSTGPAGLEEPALTLGGNQGHQGRVIEATLVRTIDASAVAQIITLNNAGSAFQARHAVEQYFVRYATVDAEGRPVIASAGIFFPVGVNERVQMLSFSHGTATLKEAVPSSVTTSHAQGVLNASHGAVAVLPDYIGNGIDAANFHPYLHAGTEASATIDALRAARSLAFRKGVRLDGRLFVYGYSQGGHAAMALVRELERRGQAGRRTPFIVTAAAPMSGAYDLSGTARTFVLDAAPNPARSIALIRTMAAYQAVYGIAETLEQVLRPPYAELGNRMIFDGIAAAEAQALVPALPRDALTDAAVTSILDDPGSRLVRAIGDNDVHDWRPRAPMRLYYATADLLVPHQNALAAEARMRERGATDVSAVSVGHLSHGAAQWPSFIAARQWFDTFPARNKTRR